jgi:mono/diheme cytochrome c family protein
VKSRLIVGTAVIGVCGGIIIAQQNGSQRAGALYNAEQASAGRAAYQTNCAACHAPDLTGREGPQLVGANFMARWGEKSAGEFIAFMRSTMPPGAGGSLPDQTYVNLAAFIFDANGAHSGDRSLTAESNVALRDVASGAARGAAATRGSGTWCRSTS